MKKRHPLASNLGEDLRSFLRDPFSVAFMPDIGNNKAIQNLAHVVAFNQKRKIATSQVIILPSLSLRLRITKQPLLWDEFHELFTLLVEKLGFPSTNALISRLQRRDKTATFVLYNILLPHYEVNTIDDFIVSILVYRIESVSPDEPSEPTTDKLTDNPTNKSLDQ